MNTKVICCVFFVICAVNAALIERRIGLPPPEAPNARARAPQWGAIRQRVDHYNSADTRTWSQRYMSNDQFYEPGGPIFVFIGGEWEIETGWLMTGQMFDMARDHRGHMFYLEHRFYGRSYPIGDFTTNSLKYIRSQQALADLVQFIVSMKESIPGGYYSKVVVVGASYSASLATWSRILYPGIIDAAYASSAPLIALEDFYQYQEVVGRQMMLASPDCYATYREAMDEMDRLYGSADGRTYLQQVLKTCSPLQNREPYRAHFFQSVIISWANLVQYAKPGDVLRQCNKVLSKPGGSFQKVVATLREELGNYCRGDYTDYIKSQSNTQVNTGSGRQWFFQTCNEFGFFQTTTSPIQPFGNNVYPDYYEQSCRDIFGEDYTPDNIRTNIAYTNSVYGGFNSNMTKVISVHGNVDPWHSIGLTSDLHALAPAYLVDGTAHCADLNSVSPSDSPQMRQVKQAVKAKIAEWIR